MSDLIDDIEYIGYPIVLHGFSAKSIYSNTSDLEKEKEYNGYSLYKPDSIYFSVNDTYLYIDGQLFCLDWTWEVNNREFYSNKDKYITIPNKELSTLDILDKLTFLYKKILEIEDRLNNSSLSI